VELMKPKVCRYCGNDGRDGPLHYPTIEANGKTRRVGPYCVDEQGCWDRRHKDVPKFKDKLEDIYG
jgi:hypothetical protein